MGVVQRAAQELKRHFDNLQQANYGQYQGDLNILRDFLVSAPIFRALIENLKGTLPAFDADEWITMHIAEARKGQHRWPDDEPRKMLVLMRAIERMVDGGDNPTSWGQLLSFGRNFNEGVNRVTREVVFPLVSYFLAQLGTESEVLHLLARFKRSLEWFDQADLYRRYESDTQKGEDVYDTALRRFLFAEGIDYPFSQPKSASGKADVIAAVESDDPLVCEVKLFNDGSYGVPYVAKGLQQVVRYAHDYGKAVGHLVVVNLSEAKLVLPSDSADGSAPPRIVTQGVTVFLLVVQGRPLASASTERKSRTIDISRNELVVLEHSEPTGTNPDPAEA